MEVIGFMKVIGYTEVTSYISISYASIINSMETIEGDIYFSLSVSRTRSNGTLYFETIMLERLVRSFGEGKGENFVLGRSLFFYFYLERGMNLFYYI